MAALREIFASFGIQADDSELKKLDNTVNGAISRLKQFGALLVGGAVARGLLYLTRQASDSNEAMNVLRETFKEHTGQVVDWADTTGEAMGRSAATLRQYAGDLGALLAPMLKNRGAAAEMSTTLAGLAVDLGSFFNRADDDVLVALRAGIVGETEPMRRLGVELTEASLQAFALENGISKSVKSMTLAEKVQLRFQKILADTADKQGDAVRTAHEFANASKALEEDWKDLSITMGQFLIGPAKGLIAWTRGLTQGLEQLFKTTKLGTILVGALGGALGVLAAKVVIATWPVLALTAAGLGLFLIFESLFQLFRGNQSAIGDAIDAIAGVGAAETAVANLKEAWSLFVDVLVTAVAAAKDAWDAMSGGPGGNLNTVGEQIAKAAKARAEERSALDTRIAERRAGMGDSAAQNAAVAAGDARAFVNARGTRETKGGALEAFRAKRIEAINSGAVAPTAKDIASFGGKITHGSVSASGGKVLNLAPQTIQGAAGGTPAGKVINIAPTNVSVTVPHGTSREMANEIARLAGQEIDKRNRAAVAALGAEG